MTLNRHSGVLLHPTSLPGPHGSGDLGPGAFHFVDWLVAAGQTRWQVLPLGGVGPGNSPYMSPSAFAGNELLIDLGQLRDAGWLSDAEIVPDPEFSDRQIDFVQIRPFRMTRLRLAAATFFAENRPEAQEHFHAFCAEASDWLDDYALFMALERKFGGAWQGWPTALAQREAGAIQAERAALADECDFWRFCQWCFRDQWASLKDYANQNGVRLIGDMPIFVSPHSADVWAHQQLFDLDAHRQARVVAGVPPDYFSSTGQLWGNPLYNWAAHREQGYRWWIERMRATLALCDIVRVDHFRGFESFWEIPAGAKTAINGHWRSAPGVALFEALSAALGHGGERLPIIAEDLGIITPAVVALRESVGLPGMRVLQFAFDGHADNPYLPHNHEPNTVVLTGTHDNDTTRGWWHALAAEEKDYVRHYLGISTEFSEWDLIRAATSSVAALAITPMQDVLGLASDCRMNQPGLAVGSWQWRFSWDQVAPWHAERLAELCRLYGRRPTREMVSLPPAPSPTDHPYYAI